MERSVTTPHIEQTTQMKTNANEDRLPPTDPQLKPNKTDAGNREYIAIALLLASCVTLGSLVLNSFVSYAPSVGATLIQNDYIESILWHAGISIALQIIAGILYFTASKSRRMD